MWVPDLTEGTGAHKSAGKHCFNERTGSLQRTTQRHVHVRNVMRRNKIAIYYWHLLPHLDSYARSCCHALSAGRPKVCNLPTHEPARAREHREHHAGRTLPEILQDLLVPWL